MKIVIEFRSLSKEGLDFQILIFVSSAGARKRNTPIPDARAEFELLMYSVAWSPFKSAYYSDAVWGENRSRCAHSEICRYKCGTQ
jgi:hypothetical protein